MKQKRFSTGADPERIKAGEADIEAVRGFAQWAIDENAAKPGMLILAETYLAAIRATKGE